MPCTIAVVDTETTGVYRNVDRVLEIAIVRIDGDGNIVDEYVSLVNPKRDVGATSIHGIRSADLLSAPEFNDIAGDVVARLSGAVVAGHNIDFDSGIIRSEFRRMNVELPEWPSICTLRLAYRFGPGSRKLESCCAHFEIEHTVAHSALHDARATAKLLHCYRTHAAAQGIPAEELYSTVHSVPSSKWPVLESKRPSFTRDCARASSREQYSYIAGLVDRLPDVTTFEAASYLNLLDRVLEDRVVTLTEAQSLEAIAQEIGLSKSKAIELHESYLRSLALVAWQDGTVSDTERHDLLEVTKLLGISEEFFLQALEESSKPVAPIIVDEIRRVEDFSGKMVCFTGNLLSTINGKPINREQAEQFARDAGMIVKDGVSKKLDVLVIADPDSQSGKAKKAREYGTRIIAERAFWQKLGILVE